MLNSLTVLNYFSYMHINARPWIVCFHQVYYVEYNSEGKFAKLSDNKILVQRYEGNMLFKESKIGMVSKNKVEFHTHPSSLLGEEETNCTGLWWK